MSVVSFRSASTAASIKRRLISERFAYEPGHVPDDVSPIQQQMLREFTRRLSDGEYRLVSESCPCGTDSESVVISEIDRYGLPMQSVLCMACGAARMDPYLDTESLENFYSELYQEMYGRALEPDAYFTRQRAYGKKIRTVMFPDDACTSKSVLEVGCGAGGGLFEFQSAGLRTVGCDFSERLISFGKQRCVRELFVGGIAAIRDNLPGERFDLIFLHHVYEHVSQPITLLHELQSVLKPDGRVLIIVPDLSRIDRYPNPAGNALDFFHVAHKYNYSTLCLQAIAQRAGMVGKSMSPPERMRTAWSRSPELWLEIQADTAAGRVDLSGSSAGESLWKYLQKTEMRYRWGVCPAQLRQTIRSIRPDRLISRAVKTLRSA